MRDFPNWDVACQHLKQVDPFWIQCIDAWPEPVQIDTDRGLLSTLSKSITSQQISVKAAASIWARVESVVDSNQAQSWLDASVEDLRSAGLSARKVEYCKDLAMWCQKHPNAETRFLHLSDVEIIEQLTQVRGIGVWTVQMFLIFNLGRPNVWPIEDMGIREALSIKQATEERLSPKQCVSLADEWMPWRSVASLYLWRFKDRSKPIC